jgi:hypothetical protein
MAEKEMHEQCQKTDVLRNYPKCKNSRFQKIKGRRYESG